MISVVACCHGAKLCAHAARDFRSQQYHLGKLEDFHSDLHMLYYKHLGKLRAQTKFGPVETTSFKFG